MDSVSCQLGTQSLRSGPRSNAGNATSMFISSRSATTTIEIYVITDVVQAKPKNKMHTDPEKLSHHVHRVGHHFPLEIIELACKKFGYIYDEAHGLRKDKSQASTDWIARRIEDYSARQQLHGRPTTEKEDKDHIRGAIRELFSKIPEADLHSIVTHAFEEVKL